MPISTQQNQKAECAPIDEIDGLLSRLALARVAIAHSENAPREREELLMHVETYENVLNRAQDCDPGDLSKVMKGVESFCLLCGIE